jgi:hypothetical protein
VPQTEMLLLEETLPLEEVLLDVVPGQPAVSSVAIDHMSMLAKF